MPKVVLGFDFACRGIYEQRERQPMTICFQDTLFINVVLSDMAGNLDLLYTEKLHRCSITQ